MTDRDIDYVHTGEYQEINPPNRLVFTWISSLTNSKPSLVTIHFKKKGDQTELVLIHEELLNRDSEIRHSGGWANMLEKLGNVLRN